MAPKHGSKAVYHLRDGIPGAGSMRNFTIYISDTTMSGPIDKADVTALGAFANQSVTGLRDKSFPISGPWTSEVDEWLCSLISASAPTDYEYAPAGSVSGYPTYTGSAYVTAYEVTAAVSDAIKFTATIQNSGSAVRSTIS